MGHGLFSLLYVHVEMILNGMMNEMEFFFFSFICFSYLVYCVHSMDKYACPPSNYAKSFINLMIP